MLHSHLPFYRKAGMWPFGEESFYECMLETYVPLLNMVADLYDEGLPAKLTIGITPILAEQMADKHLSEGFQAYVEGRIKAAKQDEERFGPRGEQPAPDLFQLSKYYLSWFQRILDDYRNRWGCNIIAGFRKYQELGAIEITTSAATHGFLPLFDDDASINLQLKAGVETHKKHFGREARGIWLPECAYRPATATRPSIDKWLHDHNLKYFFTESAVIKGGNTAETRRVFGAYGNVEYIPAGSRPKTGYETSEAYWLKDYPVAVMGRHEAAGYQVWSADHGYPGDGNYREFHKKDDKSGLHYWRLTSKTTELGDKGLYNPEAAAERARENSDHYVGLVQQELTDYLKRTGKPGLVMVSFDTELFGHWWFEGIGWIKDVIRKLKTYTAVTMQTASEYLAQNPPERAIELPESSWGAGGHYQVWLNEGTEALWKVIHACEKEMDAAERKAGNATGPVGRAMNQAARELLLLQSSDWPFLITTGQAHEYARERFAGHVERFRRCLAMVESGNVDEGALAEMEGIDNCFAGIDHKWFRASGEMAKSSANK